MCEHGAACQRQNSRVCFFAHTLDELRPLPEDLPELAAASSAKSTKAGKKVEPVPISPDALMPMNEDYLSYGSLLTSTGIASLAQSAPIPMNMEPWQHLLYPPVTNQGHMPNLSMDSITTVSQNSSTASLESLMTNPDVVPPISPPGQVGSPNSLMGLSDVCYSSLGHDQPGFSSHMARNTPLYVPRNGGQKPLAPPPPPTADMVMLTAALQALLQPNPPAARAVAPKPVHHAKFGRVSAPKLPQGSNASLNAPKRVRSKSYPAYSSQAQSMGSSQLPAAPAPPMMDCKSSMLGASSQSYLSQRLLAEAISNQLLLQQSNSLYPAPSAAPSQHLHNLNGDCFAGFNSPSMSSVADSILNGLSLSDQTELSRCIQLAVARQVMGATVGLGVV